jgi:hypothetical protein
MTLVITTGCPEFVLQVSDRRFTRLDTRLPVTDEGNKVLVVRACDADLAVSFTGLGIIEGEWTGDWLLARIAQAKAAESGFDECVEAVRGAAESAFARMARACRWPLAHTFVFAGFRHGAGQPRVVVVTNCESGNFRTGPIASTFSAHDMSSARYPYHEAGMTPAMHKDSKARIRGLIRKTQAYPAVADLVVNQIRLASSHRKHGKYVGRQCMSVCVFRSGRVEAVYHPTHSRPVTYAPNLIDTFPAQGGGLGHMSIKDVQLVGGRPMSFGPTAGGMTVLDRRQLRRE